MVRQRNLTPIYAGSNPARVVCNKWLHIILRRMNNMDDNKKGITVVEVFNKLEEVEKQNKEILEKLENMQESNAFFTKVAVRKWGNSQGIRLSKEIISRMGLKENDEVEINVNNGRMVIKKAKPTYQNLQVRAK